MDQSFTNRTHILLLAIVIQLCGLSQLQAQMWDLKQKLGSSDHEPGDNLGISVGISGAYMIAGAWWEEGQVGGGQGMTSAGAAYIYKRQANGTWVETQKLISPNVEALGYFGFYVDIEGDYALVGAFNEDSGAPNAGRVYAYHRNISDQWILDDNLSIANPGNNDYFGTNLALAGEYALIGAHGHDLDEANANPVNEAGAAFLYKRQSDNSYSLIRKLVASVRTPNDQFGKYLDIDNQGLVIGAFHQDQGIGLFEAGAVYGISCNDAVCDFDNITSADLVKFTAPDQNNFEHFGWDVAISGNWVLVGKSSESDQPGGGSGSGTGAAYFFHWENGQWVAKQKVYAPDFSSFARFGRAVSMDGPVCVIGAGTESEDANGQHTVNGAGAAYVYELQGNNQWMPVQKIIGTQRGIGDLFGEDAVDMSGIQIVIGAWLADTIGNNDIIDGGAIYVYERDTDISDVRDFIKSTSMYLLNNPSIDGMLRIHQAESNSSALSSMKMFSPEGHMIYIAENIYETEFQINLAHVPAGIYIVQFETPGHLPQTLKWVRL